MQSDQAPKNKDYVQPVPVPFVKVRKHLRLREACCGFPFLTFFRKKRGCGYLGSERLFGRIR